MTWESMSLKKIMVATVSPTRLLSVMLLLGPVSVTARSYAQTLPGALTYSWIGNSFMDHNVKPWVPDEVRDICVDGNGRFDAEETAAGAPGYYQYFDITADGGICRIGDAQGPAKIIFYPCQGLDRAGNPVYTAASSSTWNAPPEFGSIRKVVYDNAHNIMYIGGQSAGTVEDAVVRMCRYDNWTGARTKVWDVAIPYEDKSYTPETSYGAGRALSVRRAGQYVFIQYGYGYIRVHDKDSGAYLGTIKPTLHGFSGGGGQVDISHGMTAYKRKNGEYILFIEDAGHNHIVMTRWLPNRANFDVHASKGSHNP